MAEAEDAADGKAAKSAPEASLAKVASVTTEEDEKEAETTTTLRKGTHGPSSPMQVPIPASVKRLSSSYLDQEAMAEGTPPLPNGARRFHPLFDEPRLDDGQDLQSGSAEGVSGSGTGGSGSNGGSKTGTAVGDDGKTRPANVSALSMDMGEVAEAYPSPSGNIVPPMPENDSWKLGPPPLKAPIGNSPSEQQQPQQIQSSRQSPQQEQIYESPQHQDPLRGSALVDGAASPTPIPSSSSGPNTRDQSSTGSTSSLGLPQAGSVESDAPSMESQAISARSSPTSVPPLPRRESAALTEVSAASTLTRRVGSGSLLPPLRVRDFAFDESDPRHLGARDVSAPSQRSSLAGTGYGYGYGYAGGSAGGGGGFQHEWTENDELEEESDEDEERHDTFGEGGGGGEGGEGGLPHGLYVAAYDFAAESDHELSVSVGDKVRLVGHVDGGWAVVVKILESLSVDDDGSGKEKEEKVTSEKVAGDAQEIERHGEKGLVPEGYLQWVDH